MSLCHAGLRTGLFFSTRSRVFLPVGARVMRQLPAPLCSGNWGLCDQITLGLRALRCAAQHPCRAELTRPPHRPRRTTRHEGRKTHKYGGNNAGRSPASPPRPSGRADTKAPTSNAKCAVFKRSASYGPSDAASPIAIPFTNQMTNNNASSPRPSLDAGVFSCPAVAASPKPEALPMPTSGLLTRVASRGRSPSPSKVAAAMYSAPQPAIQGMIYRQQVAAA